MKNHVTENGGRLNLPLSRGGRFNLPQRQRGFIALISTIIIAAILFAVMGSTEYASFYARSDALGSENERAALALAESCINIALLALATSTDPADYDPTDQIFVVDSDSRGMPRTCSIASVAHAGSEVTVNAYASVGDSFSRVSATATLPPHIRVISWGEQ